MLRRTKEQVAPELPPKQEQVLPVELTPAHQRIYQRCSSASARRSCSCSATSTPTGFSILASITRLRQLSLHPAPGRRRTRPPARRRSTCWSSRSRDVVASGHRALVFSQFTGFLAHVRAALRRRRDRVRLPRRHHAATGRGDRRGSRTATRPVFLISLKAGGFGLNLTEADYCFLLDPWWNPATEAQAVDRAHRIGQTRTVMVYRLIAARHRSRRRCWRSRSARRRCSTGVMDDGAAFAPRSTPTTSATWSPEPRSGGLVSQLLPQRVQQLDAASAITVPGPKIAAAPLAQPVVVGGRDHAAGHDEDVLGRPARPARRAAPGRASGGRRPATTPRRRARRPRRPGARPPRGSGTAGRRRRRSRGRRTRWR